jgi:hypothetical protein
VEKHHAHGDDGDGQDDDQRQERPAQFDEQRG